jgi:asparagine synthase (glutamine-hydrolysing)
MPVALEARAPLLDHRVVEFAWRLPHSVKIKRRTTKWLLRQVLYRHVPGNWLNGPSEKRLGETDFLDGKIIRTYWSEHLSGQRKLAIPALGCSDVWRERWR